MLHDWYVQIQKRAFGEAKPPGTPSATPAAVKAAAKSMLRTHRNQTTENGIQTAALLCQGSGEDYPARKQRRFFRGTYSRGTESKRAMGYS
jgi:hypothetical protein